MIHRVASLLVLVFFTIPLFGATATTTTSEPASDKAPLTQSEKEWLDFTSPIISDYERNAFLSLKTQTDRDGFREAFWEDRDPTPGTKRNEYREEYEERMNYVMQNFNREGAIPAWKTERGQTWMKLGKPQFRKRFPEDDQMYPLELWHYRAIRDYGLPESFYVMFFQKNSIGPYRTYSPAADGPEALVKPLPSSSGANQQSRRRKHPEPGTGNLAYDLLSRVDPEIASASFSLIPTEGIYGGGISGTAVVSSEIVLSKLENVRNYRYEKHEYVDRILKGRPHVEVYYSLGPQDVKNDIYWFQSPNGYFLIDYAIQWAPDKFQMGQYNEEIYTSLTLEGTVQTAKENVMVEAINSNHEIKLNSSQFKQIRYSPFQYLGRRVIVPGNYKVSFIIKNNLSKSVVPVVEDLRIPDFDTAGSPYFSKLLLVQSTEKTSAEGKGTKPFQFEDTILYPQVDHKYPPTGTIGFFYQLFFPEKSLPLNSAHISLEYEVYQQGVSIAKATVPFYERHARDLVPGSISIYDSIRLSGANFGNARMVARLTKGEKILCESEPVVLQVEAGGVATPWRLLSGIPNFNSPYHKYVIAQQYIRLNQTQKAKELLEEAIQGAPATLEARLELMRIALKGKEYDKVLQLAHDMEIQYPTNKDLLWILGWTYYGKNQYDDAVRFFERGRMAEPGNIQLLNILADVYQRLEKYDKSLEMIDKSLALNPKQPKLIEMKEQIQSEAKN